MYLIFLGSWHRTVKTRKGCPERTNVIIVPKEPYFDRILAHCLETEVTEVPPRKPQDGASHLRNNGTELESSVCARTVPHRTQAKWV